MANVLRKGMKRKENRCQKKAGCKATGNEGATQNGEGLNSVTLAAQTFPLRCPRRHHHLNNCLYDSPYPGKFPLTAIFLGCFPASGTHLAIPGGDKQLKLQ